MSIVIAPSVIIVYRHPRFDVIVQQGVSPVLHAGNPVAHELLGIRPNAITVATTTPSGWKVLNAASRKRRLCYVSDHGLRKTEDALLTLGRNSSVIVASIGMLPPTPNPI